MASALEEVVAPMASIGRFHSASMASEAVVPTAWSYSSTNDAMKVSEDVVLMA